MRRLSLNCMTSAPQSDLEIIINNTLIMMELFKTGSVDIVHERCVIINIRSVSSLGLTES